MASLLDKFRSSWSVFMGRDAPYDPTIGQGAVMGGPIRPDTYRLRPGNARSMVASVYNQIAVDVAQKDIKHVKVDENDKYIETVADTINRTLNIEANLDQSGRALIKDAVLSMFDEGAIAIVPTELDTDPGKTDSYKIYQARVARIVEWYPYHIRVEIYNPQLGVKQQFVVEKRTSLILENPFYSIMNEENSLVKRLIKVLNQLDRTNESNSAGKIDLLVQLPYAVRGEMLKNKAEDRRKSLESQLQNSTYGIGYIDASERVIQLNRSVENNLWEQANELLIQLYNQLGFSEHIFDGTASEQEMLNYNNRTIEPILTMIVEEATRKWITNTAYTQGHRVKYFSDPFKLVPVGQIADIADKFTRNEIMSSNELRAVIGLLPSKDPKADELRNSNLNHPDEKVLMEQQNRSAGQKNATGHTDSEIDAIIESLDNKEKI